MTGIFSKFIGQDNNNDTVQISGLAESLRNFLLLADECLFYFIWTFSLDLVRVFSANADYISGNGFEGLMDGCLQQFQELCLDAIGAMTCYLIFKICEYTLVHKLAHLEEIEK